jgi:hypothetical protein
VSLSNTLSVIEQDVKNPPLWIGVTAAKTSGIPDIDFIQAHHRRKVGFWHEAEVDRTSALGGLADFHTVILKDRA